MIGRNKLIMRWLAHRGGALDFRDHALAQPRPALSDRGCARRRPGHDPGRGHARPRQPLGVSVRRTAARRAHRDGQVHRQRPAGSRDRAEIVLEGHLRSAPEIARAATRRTRRRGRHRTMSWRSKARSATTPATTTNATGSRCSPSIASRCDVTRSITRPTPASRRTSRPSSALH